MDAKAMVARVRDLPALPQALTDLLLALQREDVAIDQLAIRISRDQALTAKALRLANCSFYGVAGRVNSIHDAINVLGIRSLTTALTAAAVAGSFARPDCPGFDLNAYWRHTMACALCAQSVAESVHVDPGLAFTAGLLHDIGRLALAAQFPAAFAPAFAYRAKHDVPMRDAERQVMGFDHTDVGALVAQHWHFAPPVVEAIRCHHEPPDAAQPTLTDVVHVADNIAHALDLANAPDELVPPLSLAVWSRLDLTQAQCLRAFERTETELDELCEALAV
jgi:putative nucleotidyltransferase with HDIG domain